MKDIFIGIGFAILISALFYLLYLFSKLAFNWIESKIKQWQRILILRSVKIRDLELVTSETITEFFLLLIRLFKPIFYFALFYVYSVSIFNLFEATQNWSDLMIGYLLDSLKKIFIGVVNFVPNIFFIFVVVLVTYYIFKIIDLIFGSAEKGRIKLFGIQQDLIIPTKQIFKVLLVVVVFMSIISALPGIGDKITIVFIIILGIPMALGLSVVAGNIITGIALTFIRAFKIGDKVKIGETEGEVIDRNIITVKIRSDDGKVVEIPNLLIINSKIINYSKPEKEV